jgi:hypothetical protein
VLTLHLSHPTGITGIKVLPGIKSQQLRSGQPRPAELELISGDKVKKVHLRDSATLQKRIFASDFPKTSQVQVRIIEQTPAGNGNQQQLLAISTIQLLHY